AMPIFEYKAVGASGAVSTGSLDAGGRGEALRMIEERGLTPLKLAETAGGASKPARSAGIKLPAAGKFKLFQSKKVSFAALEDFQAREKELRAKVVAAMMYPAVLLTLAVAVVIFLLVFFIPRFQTLFEGFDAALPALTQVIVGASNVLRHYGIFVLAAVVAA